MKMEELSDEEQKRQYRLRYAATIKVLSLHELRVVAARLLAAYPQYSLQEFVRQATLAFSEVRGDVVLHGRDAKDPDATR